MSDGYEPAPDDGGLRGWLYRYAEGLICDEDLPSGMESPCGHCVRRRALATRLDLRYGDGTDRYAVALATVRARREAL